MKQVSPASSPGNLRVFLVCLLSFTILMAPFAAIAAPRSISSPTVGKAASENGKQANPPRSVLEDLFVNPPTDNPPTETSALPPAAMPEPAPQPLPPPAGTLTASMVASFPPGGDVDGDLKADPGDKIKYTVTLDNTTGAVDALGLNFTDTIDTHTTYPAVGGTVNSTPVAFDLSVSTPEDPAGGVSITISGQDPDGNNLTFLNSATGLPFGASTTLSHGTLGAFSAPDCATTPGICKTTVAYTPTVDYNGPDSFGFRVNDGIANSNEPAAVSITVTAVNDAPTFSVIPPANPTAVLEDSGSATINYINNVKPGPVSDTNENTQTVTFDILPGLAGNSNPGLFSTQPFFTVSAGAYPRTATLNFTPALNKNGTSVITYHAHDTGGTSPGVDNSADQTFTITVTPVNDKPVYSGPQKTLTVNSQMKTTGNTGLLTGITDPDAGDTGFSPQTIVIDPATIDLTNCKVLIGAITNFCTITVTDATTGTFDFDPPAGAGNAAAISFSYKAKDNGNPLPGALSDPITVNVTVNGPPIWFVDLGAGAGGTGRLSAPFNTLAAANTILQNLGTNNRIFLYSTTATTQAAVGDVVLLNTTQWLIGQGTVFAGGFDSFMGITPPANTIVRPSINSATRTTVRGKVTMIGATQVQGVNIDVSAGASQGLVGSTAGSALTIKDVNVTSAGGNAVDFNNAGTITYTNSSASSVNVLTSTTGIALNIVGGTTIGAGGLNFQTINVTGNGSSPTSGIVLNNTGATAGLTVTGSSSGLCGGDVNAGTNPFTITAPATADCTGGQIQGTGGPGISLTNTRNISLTRMWIHNTFRSGINGTTVTNFTFANGLIEKSGVDNSLNGVDLTPAGAEVSNIAFNVRTSGINNLSGTVSITDSTLRNAWYHGIDIYDESGTISNLTVGGPSNAGNSITSSTLTTQSKGSGTRIQANGSAAGAATVTKALIQGNSVKNFPSDSGMKIQGGNAGGATQAVMGTPGSATDLISITGNSVGGPNSATPLGSNGIETAMTGQGKAKFSITSNGTSTNPINHFKGIGITCSGGNFSQLVCIINNNFIDGGDNIFSSRGLVAGAQIAPGGTGSVSASITSNTVNNTAGQGIFIGLTNSNITGNVILKSNTVGAPRDTDTPAIRVESGSSSGNTNLCLDMASNTATGSTGGGLGPAPGGGVRRQGNAAGVNTFGIVGLSPSPANAVQTESYLSTQNPGSSLGSASFSNSGIPTRVYVIGSGGPTFVSCSAFTVAALKREADDTLAAVRNESGTPLNSQPGYLADASDIFQNNGTDSFSFLNARYDFAGIFEPINRPTSTAPALLAALDQPAWLGAEAAITGGNNTTSLSRGLSSVARGLAQFVSSVDSLVVPTASAESPTADRVINLHDVSISAAIESGVRKTAAVPPSRSMKSSALHAGIEAHRATVETRFTAARSNHAPVDRTIGTQSRSALAFNNSTVRPNVSRKGISLNHAEVWRAVETKSSARITSMLAPAPPSGETITVNGVGSGFKLPIGRTVTITFIVTLNSPPALSGVPPATPKVSNQGTISSSNISGFQTDDPSAVGAADPTNTPVDLYDSTTSVTSSSNPSNTSQAVTFTATIGTSGTPDGSGTNRTGTVVFKDGGAPFACSGGNQTVSSNIATCITSALTTGNHTITADYSGDGSFDPSSGSLNTNPQIVGQSGTTVTLYSSLNPAFVTQSITFTATVTTATSVLNPTGTVTFRDGGGAITCTGGSQTLNGSGVATCQISTLAAGNHIITADYSGDTNFSVNNGTVLTAFGGQAGNPQVVAQSTPTVTLGSSLNPSRVTQDVTFTGTVSAPAGVTGTPAGTLTFRDGGSAITCSNVGGQTLNGSGVGTCQVATLAAGTHIITADYVGDGSANGTAKFNNASGTLSPDQVVSKSDTTTTLSAVPPGSSAPASPVVFTAAVASQTAVTGPPAGKVQFLDGATPITCAGAGESGTSTGETLASGSANCTTSTLTTAVHSITAQYTPAASPNPNGIDTFNGSTSNAMSYTVGTPCSNPFVVTSPLNTGPNTLREGIDSKVCDGGTITFSGVTLINLATPLSITRPMTINGPGASILTVSGSSITRIFDVTSAQPVTISGMTMSGGNFVGGTGAPGSAGGILNSGNLTLSSVTLSGNQATGGVGAAGAMGGDAFGGAIVNSGTLALNNSIVNGGNTATGGKGGDSGVANGNGGSAFGGGIYNYNTGTLTLNNTTVASNSASGGAAGSGLGTAGLVGNGTGGGIYNDATASPDVVTIFNSTISGNNASTNGGGFANVGLLGNASLTIINSTISGNMASNDGGGLYNDSVTGATTITSSTVTNNHADHDSSLAGTGGGIRVVSGPVTLKDTIVAANYQASLQVETATVTGGPITTGVKQENTLTVTGGPAATTGDIIVTLAAPNMPGTPKMFTISIPSLATNDDVALAIRSALGGDLQITGYFDILGTGPQVVLRRTTAETDDLNIVLTLNGCGNSCTGINTTQSSITIHGSAPTAGTQETETIVIQSGPTSCPANPNPSTVSVTVDAAGMTPSTTVVLSVPVTDGDSADQLADTILAYINNVGNADAAPIRNFFNVSKGVTATLNFQAQAAAANDPGMRIRVASDSCTVATPSDSFPNSGTGTASTPGTPQENTLIVMGGPAAATGDIIVTLTAPGMPGNPKPPFTMSIPSGATNGDVAAAIRSTLGGDPQITGYFDILPASPPGTDPNVVLRRTSAATDDSGIVLSLNGCGNSCTGITSTASTDTLQGVAPGTGNAKVTITTTAGYFYAAGAGTKTILVPVVAGDTAAQVAAKARDVLNNDSDVNLVFMATAASEKLRLTRKVIAADDPNLTIAIDNDTGVGGSTGLLPSPPSENTRVGGGMAIPDDINGSVDTSAASSYNLIGNGGSGGLTAIFGNQVGVADPKLGPLANNGGPTFTHKLNATSPALEAGISTALTTINPLGVDAVTTTVNVASTANIPVGLTILVDTEQMVVTGKTVSALTVTRGANGTIAASHIAGANVFPAFDQRGFLRTVNSDAGLPLAVGGDDTDIGAYELQSQPGTPNAPNLDAASDTGVSNTDDITADTSPTFTISGVTSGALVELLRDTNPATGATVVASGTAVGSSIQLTDPSVAAGDFLYTARQTVSGALTSAQSAALPVTINTTTPAAPDAPDLTDGSDLGNSNSDNLTNVTAPIFNIGNVTAGFTVDLLRDGVVVASGVVAPATSSIPLTDNTNPPAGLRNYTSRQTNGGSTTNSLTGLDVTFDRTLPAAPGTPDLQAGSDSGNSADSVTNATTRLFDVAFTAEPNSTVTLLRNGTAVVTVGGVASGDSSPKTLTDADVIGDNVYTYAVRHTDAAGNSSTSVVGLSVNFDTTSLANAPDLQAASDSFGAGTTGTNGDNLTKTTPRSFDIIGTENGALVELLRAGVLVPGASATSAGGTVTLIDSTVLADGPYTYQTRQTDIAGNVGLSVPGLTVNIDTTSNAPGTPDLKTTSDAGTSTADDRTDNTPHSFDITSVTGAFVELLRDGTPVSSGTAVGASIALTDSASLPDGLYHYTARQTDPAGNGPTTSPGTLDVTIDTTAPTVSSVIRASTNPTSALTVDFTVTFSEGVTGVDTLDFAATGSGGQSDASVATVTPVTASQYTVTVNTGSGDGSLRLDVIGNGTIKDVMNLVFSANFTSGEVYTVSKSDPSVTSVIRADANPTNAASVNFNVTFNKAVTGVNIGASPDFTLTTTGTIAGASITGLSGSGANYTVTVNTGNGSGTIRLDVIDDDTIVDSGNRPIGGTGAGNGNFITGIPYDIDKTAPQILSVVKAAGQADPAIGPTSSTVINFTVTFDEAINSSSFTASDVALSGSAGATVANVSGSGTTYNVAVEGMVQSGPVTITIPIGAVTDASGNGNSNSGTATVQYFKDNFTALEVNTIADHVDDGCDALGTGGGNQDCTLREAIKAANDDFGADTITFASALNPGGAAATITLLTQLPDITTDMTIQGPGAKLMTVKRSTAGGTPRFRIFLANSAAVIISGLTINNGFTADGANNVGGTGAAGGAGGGILNTGTLTLTNVAVNGNQSGAGGNGMFGGPGGSGGGISNTGTLTLTGSTINLNQTGHGGDGNAPPPVNGTGGPGGGIFNNGTLRINNSTISGNQTGAGGSNGSQGNGGGVYVEAGTVTLLNATISLNTAGVTGTGGGIDVVSGTVTLRNTIVGANSASSGLDILGTVQSDGFNLIQSTSGATINPNPGAGPDITGPDPLLNALGDNGGPTSTHSLNCTSAAIDKGTASLTTLAGAIDNVQTSINVTSASFITAGVGFVIVIDGEQMVVTGKVGNTLTVTRGANTTTAAAHANLASVLPLNASDQRGGSRPFDLADSVYDNASGGDGSDIGAYETQSGGGCLPEAIAPPPATTTEDTGVQVTLRGEYSQNTNLIFTVTAPAHGSLGPITNLDCQFGLKMVCTAKVIYTPAADYNGLDSFKFKAVTNPGGLESQDADVNITVTSVNDPPLANSDPLSDVAEDSGPRTIPFADLLGNDSPGPADEGGQTLTIISVGSAVGGAVSIQGTDVVFTPAANFNGVASFKYTARDNGTSNGAADPKNSVLQATVTFNVTPAADTPAVTNATTNEDTQTTSGLVVSRNAGDGAEVTNFKITGITNGTLFLSNGSTLINNGDFITVAQGNAGLKFSPGANLFSPTTTFSFQAQASLNNTDPGLGGGLATATITVNAIADTPSVTNATTSVNTQTASGLIISRNAADSAEVTNFKITNIQNGTLFKNNGTTQINNNDFITFAEGNAGLKFTPANNLLSPGTTFSFEVQASTSNADAGLGGSVVTATITVTCGGSLVVNSNDSGAGSLRAILLTACPGTTITFDMTPGHVTSPITLASGLVIDKSLTIQGPGANLLTLGGNSAFRLMAVNAPGVDLTLSGLGFTGGGTQVGANGAVMEFLSAGTLTLSNDEFVANAGSPGTGVVSVSLSTGITITGSTFRGNAAAAVVKSDRTPMTVVNSTFSGNSGAAIYNAAVGSTVTNSTIADNQTGIQSDSTLCGGCAANVTVTNTLLSNNGGFNLRRTGTATLTSGGNNLIDDATAAAFSAADPTNIIVAAGAALIGPLANNGGPTQTRALLAGSPALDAGSNAAVVNPPFSGAAPFNDQRGPGFLRIRDAADVNTAQTVDIGAFEADPSIEDISNKSTTENTPVSFTFNLGDAATAFDSITTNSSNTALLPNANILISGSGSSRTMTLTPAANTSGTSIITVTVTKTLGGAPRSMSDTFLLGVNDGGTIQFSSGTYSVVENAGPGSATITRTGGTAGTATVQFATSNGTAVAGTDYTAVTQTVTFNDGETSKVVTVPIIDNLNNQPNRTINLTLSNVGGSGQLGAPITTVLTILDDDPTGGYIRFSTNNYTVGEGAGAATITVERLGTLTQQVTVDYATSDDSNPPSQIPCAPTPGNTTATSRCDFNTAIGRISFAAGDGVPKTFTVLINQDTYLEGPENLPLTLSNLTGGATFASPSTATLNITDDDLVAPTGNPIDDPASFVRQHYRDFLNREADAAGLAFWTNQIASCGADAQCIEVKRVNVSAAFFLSIEFQVTGGTAYLANKVAYGGLPNYVRFETDAQALGRNYVFGAPGAEGILEANKVAYFNEYVTRSEFTDTYNGESDQSYVNTLISNTGVAFTQLERDALINGLANQTETRATVLRKISEKPSFRQAEFNSMFVLMEYFGYLHRNPDTAGFNFWLNKLNQFNGNFIQADMVKAFINSSEYRQRFGP